MKRKSLKRNGVKRTSAKRRPIKRNGIKRYSKKRGGDPTNNDQISFVDAKNQMQTLLANPAAREGNMLKTMCNATTRGFCLDFGVYRDQIKRFFDNYSINTPYATHIKRIGNQSSNGFILRIEYEKEGFKAYSIIKCNQTQRSDNLLYEYFVGMNFINKFVPIFPCFVETYEQLYFFNDPANKTFAKKLIQSPLTPKVKKHFTEVLNVKDLVNPADLSNFANNACKFGKKSSVSIMMQYFANFISIADHDSKDEVDIPNCLFQVYFVLNVLKDVYTHYDLHQGNVLLYKPYLDKKYIEMHYHFNDGKIITFPTEHIVKIIDYGRSYFNNKDAKIDSQMVFDNICANYKAPECMETTKNKNSYATMEVCGETAGIQTGEYALKFGRFHYITPNKKNISHDLRLVNIPHFNTFIQRLKPSGNEWNKLIVGYESQFGTRERINTDFMTKNYEINNVTNMADFLKLTLDTWNDKFFEGWKTKILSGNQDLNKYASPAWTKMGDMHIYEDMRPYEFIPSTYD